MKQKRFVSNVLIFDENNRVLLQHRDDGIAILPGHWSFFGGAIDEGETPEEAVKREAIEELEYTLTNPRLVMTQEFDTDVHIITRYIYIEKYNPIVKLVLHEGQGMGWYKHGDMGNLKIDKFDKEAIDFVVKMIAGDQVIS